MVSGMLTVLFVDNLVQVVFGAGKPSAVQLAHRTSPSLTVSFPKVDGRLGWSVKIGANSKIIMTLLLANYAQYINTVKEKNRRDNTMYAVI